MSDRIVVDRRVDAPADAVLAAIREAAAATRFLDLPKPMRGGARGLAATIRGTRFTVRIDTLGEGDGVDLRGAVLVEEDGATRVHATTADDRHAGAIIAALVVVAALLWLFRVGGAGWVLGFAAVYAVLRLVARGAGWTGDDRAAYLADWLNGVLDRFPAASLVHHPPSPAATVDGGPVPASSGSE